jgi:uncharacterized membrane protein YccC
MVTYATVGVILFAPWAELAYGFALLFTTGTLLTAGVAMIIDLAVLPGRSGFVSLSLTLAVVIVPLAAWSVSGRYKAVFIAMVANLMPFLALTNPPNYDAAGFFNNALAIIAGPVAAALSFQVIPPLSPARRIERLRILAVRDLQRLSGRRLRLSRAAWMGRMGRRLAALPAQTTLEEGAQMLAVLSVGEAVIILRDGDVHPPAGRDTDRALANLAAGDIAGARQVFAAISAPGIEAGDEPPTALSVRAAAAVIVEALTRHHVFFEAAVLPATNDTRTIAAEAVRP